MSRRPDGRTQPSWTGPGARWGPWLYWPMLCLSIGFLVWRVADGAGGGSIALSAVHVLVWACLLLANRSARRGR
ncbi:hypothetical protein [Streptomyces beigongshangae]|uniref:hypothetical protein n=1 Tax=Streptomyces beigongshangae TaxID=2841597 RepID=UPI001C852844|nr:hypothetical protein [Streptomyces sp. REN17]